MSDLIRLVDLEAWSTLGVPEAERARPQRLLITVEMRTDAAKAAATDDLASTVNYDAVAQYICHFAGERPRHLLETFAEDLARDLLGAFPIQKLKLKVKKFVLPDTDHVSIEIERKATKKVSASRKAK